MVPRNRLIPPARNAVAWKDSRLVESRSTPLSQPPCTKSLLSFTPYCPSLSTPYCPFFTKCRDMPWHNLQQNLPRHTTEPSTDLHGIPWNPNPAVFSVATRCNRGAVHRIYTWLLPLTRSYPVNRRGASNDSMEDVEDPVRSRLDRRAELARQRYLTTKGCRSSTHKGRRMVLPVLLLRG